jgi:hypothetical protein
VFALLWQVLNKQYWEMVAVLVIIVIIAVVTKTLKSSRTFWLEMIAFYSTFLSIIIKKFV